MFRPQVLLPDPGGGFQGHPGAQMGVDKSEGEPESPHPDANPSAATSTGPEPWRRHFDKRMTLSTPRGDFAAYVRGSGSTAMLLLHGGGLASQSFALLASELASRPGGAALVTVAFDFRGHGETLAHGDEADLSTATLCKDVVAAVTAAHEQLRWSDAYLVGHSMGGAIAIHLAAAGVDAIPGLAGLGVIDVVEGSALEACAQMEGYLASRPKGFKSQAAGIEWCLASGQLRNRESAEVSVPAQLAQITPNDNLAADLSWRWRVKLEESTTHWEGWFTGISELFLAAPVPKLLLLAGITTLDRTLTIAQMQGKFQMEVVDKVGHCVHEDAPGTTAQILHNFIKRFGRPS